MLSVRCPQAYGVHVSHNDSSSLSVSLSLSYANTLLPERVQYLNARYWTACTAL
jgi:hypothetical protein